MTRNSTRGPGSALFRRLRKHVLRFEKRRAEFVHDQLAVNHEFEADSDDSDDSHAEELKIPSRPNSRPNSQPSQQAASVSGSRPQTQGTQGSGGAFSRVDSGPLGSSGGMDVD